MSSTLQIILLLVLASVPQRLGVSSAMASGETESEPKEDTSNINSNIIDKFAVKLDTNLTTGNSNSHSSKQVPAAATTRLAEIEAAIERFKAALSSRQQQTTTTTSSDKFGGANSQALDKSDIHSLLTSIQGRQGGQDQDSQDQADGKRKLIRSRYRLRSHKEPTLNNQQQQQEDSSTGSLSNYSQPFVDSQQQQQQPLQANPITASPLRPSITVAAVDSDYAEPQQQQQQLQQLGRSLGHAPTSTAYTYQQQQQQQQQQKVASSAAQAKGADRLGSSVTYAAEVPSSQQQQQQQQQQDSSQVIAGNSVVEPAIQQDSYLPALGRMYAGPSGASAARLRTGSTPELPAVTYLSSPSSQALPASAAGYQQVTDHYGGGGGGGADLSALLPSSSPGDYHSGDHSQPHHYYHHQPRATATASNYSATTSFLPPADNHWPLASMDAADFASLAGSQAAASNYDYLDSPLGGSHSGGGGGGGGFGPRSRWSWPWTDISSFGGGLPNLNSAATFKKHHKLHHHHYHPVTHGHHKEVHDHHQLQHHQHGHHEQSHDEHNMMMPKWEHGITIGEIVCVALAVVLGIVILGSPFFLLFLMLFNGGNLFGATQMGLLAPATVQGALTANGANGAAGRRRRRRRRSIQEADEENAGDKGDKGGEESKGKLKLGKLRTSDLIRAGEYLFEHLSPFMDADKLMRSFERMMDVKDDIEKIIAKLGNGRGISSSSEQNYEAKAAATAATTTTTTTPQHQQHIEMRRRKK